MKKSKMKWIRLALAAVFMTSLSVGMLSANKVHATGSDEYNVKLMSFNIRNLHGDDGTVNSWDNRKGRAVNVINGFGPDIIGMQEAFQTQIDYFISNLNNSYASIGVSRFGNTTDEYSNIMYRTDKFTVLESGQFWLSDTPDVPGSYSSYDSTWPRVATWAKFQAKGNSRAVFYYFNTHFSLVEAAKQQSANLIIDRIKKYVTADNVPVFIGGDLNSSETTAAYSIIQNSDFEDTWVQAGKTWTDDSTGHGWTDETDIPNEHIDWIFHRNGIRINSIAIDRYSENGLYPSDHYPVELNMDIPLTGEPSPDRGSGGTVSALYTDSPAGEEAAKAFDNSNKTKYYTPHGTNVWLQYRFANGSEFAINRYKLTSANDYPERDPQSWTLHGSNDGANWTTVDTRSNQTFDARYQVKEYKFSNTAAYEYYRLNMTSRNGTSLQIAEIELYDNLNVVSTGALTADAHNTGEETVLASDGSMSTKWCASGAEPHWLKVDLGQVNNVYQFVVKHAASGGEAAGYNTVAYQIQYSLDGTTWTDAVNVTDNKANVTTHNVNIFGRYLRLYITDAAASSGNTAARIYEFEAYGLSAGATFYKDGGYAGTAVTLPKGNYTLAQLQEAGIANDSITSLKVFGGCTVELYEDNNFGGAKVTKTADDASLSDDGFNDLTSSIKIY
ncbi:discoidin domain-containing protein [Paenibacillus sp. S150]|uniref:discoidin domain-containing protein n=1 Tax=Paenibacillus sp. S150 TaxID=2749826 RepID=UPI001C591173|nr:discoidin domain-containing protein [Paenibacillus sp. S150]MBW4079873.1 discoidin domain-containing protein [Paenibacillus sp. S150]